MTNGVTPRRWIHCANPALSEIFTKYLGHLVASPDVYLKFKRVKVSDMNEQMLGEKR